MVTAVFFALLFVALYLLGRPVRRFVAWGTGDEKIAPKEKILFFVPIIAILGGVAGWFADPFIGKVMACHANGTLNLPCILGLR